MRVRCDFQCHIFEILPRRLSENGYFPQFLCQAQIIILEILQCIPVGIIFAFLNLGKNFSFSDSLLLTDNSLSCKESRHSGRPIFGPIKKQFQQKDSNPSKDPFSSKTKDLCNLATSVVWDPVRIFCLTAVLFLSWPSYRRVSYN